MAHAHQHHNHRRSPVAAALETTQQTSAQNTTDGTGFAELFPFSVGLTGVDNNSNYLFFHISILSLCGILLATLALRWGKMLMAQLRHMTVLSNPTRQRFWAENRTNWWPWLKKHLLYAPLWRTRHNRQFQLTEAHAIGTLPSRGHMLLLVLYGVMNLVWCLSLPYSETAQTRVAQLRGRAGVLAALNIVPTVVFALRNNPLIWLLQTPYDTFNLFHRWIARIFIVESVVHVGAWLWNTVHATPVADIANAPAGSWDAVKLGLTQGPHAPSYMWGLVGAVSLCFILIQTWGPLRHAFYETFLFTHKVFVLLAIIGIYLHLKIDSLPQWSWIVFSLVIWIAEYVFRLYNILYHNYGVGHGWSRVTVEALAGEACRVTFDLARPWRPRPGAHCHIYIPSVSGLSSHPFSVAWTNVHPLRRSRDEKLPTIEMDAILDRTEELKGSVSFVIRSRTGFTRQLYNKAASLDDGVFMTYGAVEGPYAGHDSLNSFGTVLLFAGGIGITHQVGYVRDLMNGCRNGTSAAKKVILIWSVPNTESLEWVRPWMDEILKMPGRRDVLKIQLFITKPRSHAEVVSGTGSIQMFPGRCNPQTIIDKEIVERMGAMGVTVCGPGAFADDVRRAARRRVQVGVLDFVEEAFTY
jgi:predicted ferric reductase